MCLLILRLSDACQQALSSVYNQEPKCTTKNIFVAVEIPAIMAYQTKGTEVSNIQQFS